MKAIGATAAGFVADKAVEDLRRLEDRLDSDLLRALLRLNTIPGEDTLERRQLQVQAELLRQVQERLKQEGEAIVRVTGTRAVEAVAEVLGRPPATLSTDIRAELDQIVRGQLNDVMAVFGAARLQIFDAVAAGIVSNGSLGDLVEKVSTTLSVAYGRASAAVDSAIMAAGRAAVMADAREMQATLDLVFVYVGPKDVKNRPFCAQWVGKACTVPEKLVNGQGLPVEHFCGGYNCRHSWAPVPFDLAVAQGIKILTPEQNPFVVDSGPRNQAVRTNNENTTPANTRPQRTASLRS